MLGARDISALPARSLLPQTLSIQTHLCGMLRAEITCHITLAATYLIQMVNRLLGRLEESRPSLP